MYDLRAVGPVRAVAFYVVQLKVQSYSPGVADMLTHLIHCSLSPYGSAVEAAFRSV